MEAETASDVSEILQRTCADMTGTHSNTDTQQHLNNFDD